MYVSKSWRDKSKDTKMVINLVFLNTKAYEMEDDGNNLEEVDSNLY